MNDYGQESRRPNFRVVYEIARLLASIRFSGCSEQQAKRTFTRAQSLISSHGVRIEDVLKESQKIQDEAWQTWKEPLDTRYELKHELSVFLCEQYYFVEAFHSNYKVTMFGLDEHVFTAREVFRTLLHCFEDFWWQHRQVKRYFGPKEPHRKSFMTGVYDRVNERLRKRRENLVECIEDENEGIDRQRSKDGGIILSKKEEVDPFKACDILVKSKFKRTFPDLRASKRREKRTEVVDYRAGYEAGKRVVLVGLEEEGIELVRLDKQRDPKK